MADFSNKELPFIKRRPVITAAATVSLIAGIAFQVLNRNDEVIFQVSEDGSIITTELSFSGGTLQDESMNKFPSFLTGAQFKFSQIQRPQLMGPGRVRLREFTVRQQFNTAITGGVGLSGATYVPEVDLLFMTDNNVPNVSIYPAACINQGCVEFGNITFAGFTSHDPEALQYMWTIYDANGKPDQAVFAVSDEDSNDITLFEWDLQATSGTITKSDWPTIVATNMWTPDATLGMESLTYIPERNALFSCRQAADECRFIPLNGSLTPAATEPFDATTVWAGAFPAVNDLAYDRNTGLIIAIGDQTGASNNNQDIWAFDPDTGAVVDNWQNFPSQIGLDGATNWTQSEGIEISPDGQSLFITSEGNEAAWLQRRTNLSNSGTIIVTASGAIDFNAPGVIVDYRFRSDNDAALLFLDGSSDRIGVGTALAETKLEVNGTVSGATLYSPRSINSSGSLVWEGTATGAIAIVGVNTLNSLGLDVNGNMSGRTIFLNGMPGGQALCKKTTGDIGQCTSVVGAGGGCTCS